MSGLILSAANEFSVIFLGTARSDDSTGDRLSYRYTCAILVAFTVIVSNREFTMKRIQCWVPAYFTGNYEDYTNNVCWVRNTYYVDDESPVPAEKELRREASIRYYQWIPFILLFEAFFFYFPYMLWRMLCQRSGIDIRDMVEAATNFKKATDEKKREQLMQFMVSVIDQYVDDPRRQSNNRETVWWKKCFLIFFPSSGRYMGDYLRNLFLFIKLLYMTNVFLQVMLLSYLLDQPFWHLGLTVLKYLYEGRGWNFHSRYFPKVTLCDFQIREANALPIAHTYTVMCVLPINLFNQQIFTFLWFWFVIVILCTVYDLLIWIFRLFFRRDAFLRERLKVLPSDIAQQWPFRDLCKRHINPQENEHLWKVSRHDESASTGDETYRLSDGQVVHHQSRMFIVPSNYYEQNRTLFHFFNMEYLEADGYFILRIIGTNASDFVATIILHRLYKTCCEKRFRPDKVIVKKPVPRKTLYKYLIIPKEMEEEEEEAPPVAERSRSVTRNPPGLPRVPRSASTNDQSRVAELRAPEKAAYTITQTQSHADMGPLTRDSDVYQRTIHRSQSRLRDPEEQ